MMQSIGADNAVNIRRTRVLFWASAVALGLAQAWANRHFMSSDGISYLDMGDAFIRRDWHMFVNAWWSPLYPILLGSMRALLRPSPYWEFTCVHLLNFFIFIFALVCFEFFLRQLIAELHLRNASTPSPMPEWCWWALGYIVFLWSSLSLISLQTVSPDMLMAGFTYIALGLLLRIRAQTTARKNYALLGVVLGLGYLAKAPMFPLALIFLATCLLLSENFRTAPPRVLVAFVIFGVIATPWISALSHVKHRFTFGDTGRLNYMFYVNHAGPFWFWQDVGSGQGKFLHPPRKIFDQPPAYEFGTPLQGTQPVWYDPSYWGEGGRPKFNLRGQISVLKESLDSYLASWPAALTVGLVALAWFSGRGTWSLRDIGEQWPVWLTALAGLGMYSVILVQHRYIAVFLAIFWLGLFSGLRLPNTADARRAFVGVVIGIVVAMAIPLAGSAFNDLIKIAHRPAHAQWRIAQQLRNMGIQSGDRVARIGGTRAADWARLLRASVIAEVPYYATEEFWTAPPQVQKSVLRAFAEAGAKAVVAQSSAHLPPADWRRLGNSDYFALLLPVAGQTSAVSHEFGVGSGSGNHYPNQ